MSRYLKYTIENMEPIRIADDETSQHGQTDTLRHIPGSTVRGMIAGALLACPEGAERDKAVLLSEHIHFMNAYLTVGDKELIPSLKGFYEDKTEKEGKKELENVIAGDLSPGVKRASLGRYCYVDGDCICYTDTAVSEDLNIRTSRTGEKAVFRSQYIRKHQSFTGYITFDDTVEDALIERISAALDSGMRLGNRRSAGYGSCRVTKKELLTGLPYENIRNGEKGDEFYLVLLSGTAMRDEWGEPTGLNLAELSGELGCDSLEILRCAASTCEVHGYNRVWKGTVPSVTMYEAGSVFHLRASGEIPEEGFRRLEEKGIGIRRNEGFGQIAILKGYGDIRYKQAISGKLSGEAIPEALRGADISADRRIAAKGLLLGRIERGIERRIARNPLRLGGASRSKWGVVLSMCMNLRYEPQKAAEQLEEFVRHSEKKEEGRRGYNKKPRQDALHRYIHDILDGELLKLLEISEENGRILGIAVEELLTEEEKMTYKLNLIIRQIRYAYKEVKKDEV